MKQRAAVVIIRDGEVALIKRDRAQTTYYLFPGGTVEPGETVEQAAIREAYEELGVQVSLGRLVAVVERADATQYHFLASIQGGTFGTGMGEELESSPESAAGTYTPCWLPVADLLGHDVRPRQLAKAIRESTIATLTSPLLFTD